MIISNIAITAIIIRTTLRMIILIIIIMIRRNIYEKFIRKTQLCIRVDKNKCTKSKSKR